MQQVLLAGPLLRHVAMDEFTLWFVTTRKPCGRLTIGEDDCLFADVALDKTCLESVQVGGNCFINLLHLSTNAGTLLQPLPTDKTVSYDLHLDVAGVSQPLLQLAPQLAYANQQSVSFRVPARLRRVLHGSCRKPHYPQPDALVDVDRLVDEGVQTGSNQPDVLLFTGDQVYVDDVAGAMLSAIHQLIDQLQLFDETWQSAPVNNLHELRNAPECFYQRHRLLPNNKANEELLQSFFRGKRKPIFTSVGAHNHLVAFSEMIAMYLLVWSDTPWQYVDIQQGRECIPKKFMSRYLTELQTITDFAKTLPQVRRALANIPVYMIFDDHDVTDDWNLTRGWEEAAYGHEFSKRIIGNALLSYFLCQGWGNKPSNYDSLKQELLPSFSDQGINAHNDAVNAVLKWSHWHYVVDTAPKMVVLDTRTQRWRSESNAGKPSGLMDWESLSELQQELLDQPNVILVSPAPIFGVKLIEVIQRLFTFIGQPLLVDAENWMAHPGSANVLLNIFRHPRTPPDFIILSGDVHYSFAYDVSIRRCKTSPTILQVTASGLKNAFPKWLLRVLDRINVMVFSSRSPLNIFTKRRRMKVKRRRPNGKHTHVLFNHSGIGEVVVAKTVADTQVKVHSSDGRTIEFM